MPFDLYCRVRTGEAGNSHFLAMADVPRLRLALAAAASLTLGGLAVWSASLPSRVPLLAGAGLCGLMLLALPLRFFPSSRVLAVLGWLLAFGTAAAWREGLLSPDAERLIVAGVTAVALLALIATVAIDEGSAGSGTGPRRLLASLLSSAVGVAAYLVVLQVDSGAVSSQVSSVLVDVLLGLMAGALLLAALSGLLHGVKSVHYDPPLSPPRRLQAPSLPRRSEPTRLPNVGRSFPERLADTMSVIGSRIATTAAGGCETLLRGIWWLLNLVIAAAAVARHLIAVWLTRARMVLALAVVQAARELFLAAAAVAAAVRAWATSFLLAIAGLVAAAIMAVVACGWFESYLTGYSLLYGPATLILAGVAAGELVLVWWALTKWSLQDVGESAQHTSERAGPTAFLALLLVGWLDGLAGVAGVGSIRPGLLTITGTVLLAVVTYVYLGRRRIGSNGSAASDAEESAHP